LTGVPATRILIVEDDALNLEPAMHGLGAVRALKGDERT